MSALPKFSILLFSLLTASTLTTPATAGIVVDVDGDIVWHNSADDTAYYFYRGSYNSASIPPEGFADPFTLANALRNDLNGMGVGSIPYRSNTFTFAGPGSPLTPTNDGIAVRAVYYYQDAFTFGQWTVGYDTNIDPDGTSVGGLGPFYWASTTAPSGGTVPEPSTAIAMGLLGVVGFAGNRRRRRSATV